MKKSTLKKAENIYYQALNENPKWWKKRGRPENVADYIIDMIDETYFDFNLTDDLDLHYAIYEMIFNGLT